MRLSTPFSRTPDLILDQLLPSLSDRELRVLLLFIRYTLGFDKLTTALRIEVLASKSGLSERSVRRAIKDLETRGWIRRQDRPGRSSRFTLTLPGVSLVEDGTPLPHPGQPWHDTPVSRDPHVERKLSEHEREPSSPREEDLFPPSGSGSCSGESDPHRDVSSSLGANPSSVSSETLESMSDSVARKLEGRTRRSIRAKEILPTLRELTAEIRNQELDVDLESFVVQNVERGLEANRRKHGASSSIYTWRYFIPGLFEGLQQAVIETAQRRKVAARQAEIREAEEERSLAAAQQLDQARQAYEALDSVKRSELEAEAMRHLAPFIRQSVIRDRQSGTRGSGWVALEQTCLRLLMDSGPDQSVCA